MINKLCVILAVVPVVILYGIKVYENRMWLTCPIAVTIGVILWIGVVVGSLAFFINIGWLPK